MAVNLAEKYSPIVDERFRLGTVTNIAFNADYDWTGVQTVNVYSVATVPMTDYSRSGMSRYGNPTELQDTKQALVLTQDRAFALTVDRGNNMDQMGVKSAATALRRQIDEVIIPELDTYRLARVAAEAGGTDATAATEDNAYKLFLAGQEFLGESKVPSVGRIAFMTHAFYNMLKLDDSFVKQGDMSQTMLTQGVLGMVDGVPLIPVPKSYLPVGAQFILLHPIAACAPVKLAEFTLHENPPGRLIA